MTYLNRLIERPKGGAPDFATFDDSSYGPAFLIRTVLPQVVVWAVERIHLICRPSAESFSVVVYVISFSAPVSWIAAPQSRPIVQEVAVSGLPWFRITPVSVSGPSRKTPGTP